jgi:hypothetical protein
MRVQTLAVGALAIVTLALAGCSDTRNQSGEGTAPPPATTATGTQPAGSPAGTTPPPANPSAASNIKVVVLGDSQLAAKDPRGTGLRPESAIKDAWLAGRYGEKVFKAAQDVWVAWIDANPSSRVHWAQAAPRIAYPGDTYNTNCPNGGPVLAGTPEKPQRGFYCAPDGADPVIGVPYLPSYTFYHIWQGLPAEQANFVGALVAANVYSYHLAQVLQEQLGLPVLSPGAARLVTACYTGIWTRAVYPGAEIKPEWYTQALLVIQKGVGLPLGAGEAEPTTEQLAASFGNGLVGGKVSLCGQGGSWPGTEWK